MYTHIIVPVDLEHVEALAKAIGTAKVLAGSFKAKTTFVAVTAETPTPVAHNPVEFGRKMSEFVAGKAGAFPNGVEAKWYVAHDPTAQIDGILHKAISEIGADLVVMASHIPNVIDAIWPSHGGKMASHANVSVFVVR